MRDDAGWYLDTYDIFGIEGLDQGGNFSEENVWEEKSVEETDEAEGENTYSVSKKGKASEAGENPGEADDLDDENMIY